MAFLKKNCRALLCILIGILNFILFAFSYISISSEMFDKPIKGNGYDSMSFWGDYGFFGVMISLFQIFVIICAIALITVGVISLLRDAFGISIPEIPGMKYSTLSKIVLWGYCGLNALIFIFIIFGCFTKFGFPARAGMSSGDYPASFGPGFGLFVVLVFNVAYFLCDFMFIPKFVSSESGPTMEYKCVKCGKKVSASTKFCPDCGGEIAGSVKKEFEFVCSKCGKKVSASTKFCPECGGAVEAREKHFVKYVCEKCGRTASKTDKFCPECGGAVKEVEYTTPEAPAPETPAPETPAPETPTNE